MNTFFTIKAATIVAAMLVLPVAQASGMPKADYKAAKTRITATYDMDKTACDSMADNAKDVCVEEAKAKEKVALAELKFNYSGKATDHNKLLIVKAETIYSVAKEKCDDKAGNEKDVCVKEAKAIETKAIADAKMSKQIGEAKTDAADDKRDADYKVSVQKCEAMAGDAKDSCMAAAKAKFGKS